jgi:hypothetical protein
MRMMPRLFLLLCAYLALLLIMGIEVWLAKSHIGGLWIAKLAATLALLWAAVETWAHGMERWLKSTRTTWWNRNAGDRRGPDWTLLHDMLTRAEFDPLVEVDGLVPDRIRAFMRSILTTAIVGIAALWGLYWLWGEAPPSKPEQLYLITATGQNWSGFAVSQVHSAVADHSASYVALFATLVAAGFAFFNMQAQQKAKSRQEWVDKLREEMAKTIALSQEYAAENRSGCEAKNRKIALRQELTDVRLKLELRLNPSEKDHRLLMYLVQRMAFWDEYEKGGEPLERIEEAKGLKLIALRDLPALEKILEPTKDQAGFAKTVSYAMRLSHVILKREWERVKTTS